MRCLAIAGRELRSLFVSPLGWCVLAVVQVILAYLFLIQLDLFFELQPRLGGRENSPGVSGIVVTPLFGSAATILLLVVPLITMRLLSAERQLGTLAQLRSAPLTSLEIVLGKYLGVLGFLGILLGLLALMPLSLLAGGTPDPGRLAAGLLGVALLLAAFAAAGLFLSSLTRHPAAAAVTTFGLLVLLWIVDWAGANTAPVIEYLSLLNRYENLLQGLFDTADVIYFALFVAVFLTFTVIRLEWERLAT